MTESKAEQLHLGVLLYGCGHHQAAWLMPDSSVEHLGEISYYQSLAQLAEKGYFDAVFFADNQSFPRSEEHTSELQSRGHLVCRLLLEKKKNGHALDRV